jgi:AhpD family alkylhydroperoxidase
MKKTMYLSKSVVAICITFFALSTTVQAQESQTDKTKKMEAEMKQAFGTIPPQFTVFPEHLRVAAWEMMKARQSPEAALPAKYSQLISLGVASQIPCTYCVYFHTKMAKMLGATDKEIEEAVASAADTRFWSTVVNGAQPDYDETTKKIDQMLAHAKEQIEASKPPSK